MNAHQKPLPISLSGELTIYTAAEIKATLAAAMESADSLEIDLFGVTEIDTAGLQLLLMTKRAADKKIAFINHSQPVLRLVDLANLGGVFGDPLLISATQP